MPRRLLRDGRVVVDDWRYLAQISDPSQPTPQGDLIIPFDGWKSSRDEWLAQGGRLGVLLAPAHRVEDLTPDLGRLALVAAEFSGPGEGRGYTQARLLRERFGFTGELRAMGYVRRDQLFFLARCGFNSFELPDSEIQDAASAFSTFTAAYQPSNDAGLPGKLPLARP